MLVSAVPFGPGTSVWRTCRFIAELLGYCVLCLVVLAGSFLVMLVPIIVGCGTVGGRSVTVSLPGLESLPRRAFLNELLVLFRYSPRSGTALLQGTLPLRYCAGRLASRIPTWRLPVDGHAGGLVTGDGGEVGLAWVEHNAHAPMPGFEGGGRVDCFVGLGGGVKRVRLSRKLQNTF